jgi:hypothetical protein
MGKRTEALGKTQVISDERRVKAIAITQSPDALTG